MCDICKRYVCPASCPNAEEPETIHICESCGTSLYAGDRAYRIKALVYCEDCIIDAVFEVEE